ncbi:MAG: hypothetical protein R2867_24925 [Caldilineaceae bacterium]
MRIQPNESISLNFDAKKPGAVVDVESVQMNFSYNTSFGEEPADAYERLLLDAMLGDSTLFIRRDEIEVAWDRITNILDGWEELDKTSNHQQIPQYAAGTWGPAAADELMERDGRYWRNS